MSVVLKRLQLFTAVRSCNSVQLASTLLDLQTPGALDSAQARLTQDAVVTELDRRFPNSVLVFMDTGVLTLSLPRAEDA